MPAKPKKRLRYPLSHTEEDREMFDIAAATCGLSLAEWAIATLRAEAKKATHVAMVKREGRRG